MIVIAARHGRFRPFCVVKVRFTWHGRSHSNNSSLVPKTILVCISIDRNQVGANDNVPKEFLGRRMGLDGPETTNEVCD